MAVADISTVPGWRTGGVFLVFSILGAILSFIFYLLESRWSKRRGYSRSTGMHTVLSFIKQELFLLGLASLLLTAVQDVLLRICIPSDVARYGFGWTPEQVVRHSRPPLPAWAQALQAQQPARPSLLVSAPAPPLDAPAAAVPAAAHGGASSALGKALPTNLVSDVLHPSDPLNWFDAPGRQLLGLNILKASEAAVCSPGLGPLFSSSQIYQIHLLLFLFAATHLVYVSFTLVAAMLQVRWWRGWEAKAPIPWSKLEEKPGHSIFGGTRRPRYLRAADSIWRRVGTSGFTHAFKVVAATLTTHMLASPVTKAIYYAVRLIFIDRLGLDYTFDFSSFIERAIAEHVPHLMKLGALQLFIAAGMLSFPYPSYLPYAILGLTVLLELLLTAKLTSVTALMAAQSLDKFGDAAAVGIINVSDPPSPPRLRVKVPPGGGGPLSPRGPIGVGSPRHRLSVQAGGTAAAAAVAGSAGGYYAARQQGPGSPRAAAAAAPGAWFSSVASGRGASRLQYGGIDQPLLAPGEQGATPVSSIGSGPTPRLDAGDIAARPSALRSAQAPPAVRNSADLGSSTAEGSGGAAPASVAAAAVRRSPSPDSKRPPSGAGKKPVSTGGAAVAAPAELPPADHPLTPEIPEGGAGEDESLPPAPMDARAITRRIEGCSDVHELEDFVASHGQWFTQIHVSLALLRLHRLSPNGAELVGGDSYESESDDEPEDSSAAPFAEAVVATAPSKAAAPGALRTGGTAGGAAPRRRSGEQEEEEWFLPPQRVPEGRAFGEQAGGARASGAGRWQEQEQLGEAELENQWRLQQEQEARERALARERLRAAQSGRGTAPLPAGAAAAAAAAAPFAFAPKPSPYAAAPPAGAGGSPARLPLGPVSGGAVIAASKGRQRVASSGRLRALQVDATKLFWFRSPRLLLAMFSLVFYLNSFLLAIGAFAFWQSHTTDWMYLRIGTLPAILLMAGSALVALHSAIRVLPQLALIEPIGRCCPETVLRRAFKEGGARPEEAAALAAELGVHSASDPPVPYWRRGSPTRWSRSGRFGGSDRGGSRGAREQRVLQHLLTLAPNEASPSRVPGVGAGVGVGGPAIDGAPAAAGAAAGGYSPVYAPAAAAAQRPASSEDDNSSTARSKNVAPPGPLHGTAAAAFAAADRPYSSTAARASGVQSIEQIQNASTAQILGLLSDPPVQHTPEPAAAPRAAQETSESGLFLPLPPVGGSASPPSVGRARDVSPPRGPAARTASGPVPGVPLRASPGDSSEPHRLRQPRGRSQGGRVPSPQQRPWGPQQ